MLLVSVFPRSASRRIPPSARGPEPVGAKTRRVVREQVGSLVHEAEERYSRRHDRVDGVTRASDHRYGSKRLDCFRAAQCTMQITRDLPPAPQNRSITRNVSVEIA